MNRLEIKQINLETEINIKSVEQIIHTVFNLLDIDNWELSIVLCDDEFIRSLNKNYRGKDEATDVLSFPQIDVQFIKSDTSSLIQAGDIVISINKLKKNSSDFNVDINEEFTRLLIHGILHLKGFKHKSNNMDEEMLDYQEKLLRKVSEVKIF